jgi:hypothetical protein
MLRSVDSHLAPGAAAGTTVYKENRAMQTPFVVGDTNAPNGGDATVSITLERETDVRLSLTRPPAALPS